MKRESVRGIIQMIKDVEHAANKGFIKIRNSLKLWVTILFWMMVIASCFIPNITFWMICVLFIVYSAASIFLIYYITGLEMRRIKKNNLI